MTQRSIAYIRGVIKRYGPSTLKKRLWDKEFSGTHWDFIDNTAGDCVYAHIDRFLNRGSILDLGCGPGNTANELSEGSYSTYVGVDISEAALAKARRRTSHNGRADKNDFVCSDFFSYKPTQLFDVILFRESMYHVPESKVKTLLNYFAPFLRESGVFIVRMNISGPNGTEKRRLAAAVQVMEKNFALVEKAQHGENGPTVIVFQPKKEGLRHS